MALSPKEVAEIEAAAVALAADDLDNLFDDLDAPKTVVPGNILKLDDRTITELTVGELSKLLMELFVIHEMNLAIDWVNGKMILYKLVPRSRDGDYKLGDKPVMKKVKVEVLTFSTKYNADHMMNSNMVKVMNAARAKGWTMPEIPIPAVDL